MKENAKTSRLAFTKARKPFVVPRKQKGFNQKNKTKSPPKKQTNKQTKNEG